MHARARVRAGLQEQLKAAFDIEKDQRCRAEGTVSSHAMHAWHGAEEGGIPHNGLQKLHATSLQHPAWLAACHAACGQLIRSCSVLRPAARKRALWCGWLAAGEAPADHQQAAAVPRRG